MKRSQERAEKLRDELVRIDTPFDNPAGGVGQVCLYVAIGERVALIDTGVVGVRPYIEAAFSELGLSLEELDLIVYTHGHPDHIGGHAEIKRAAPGAQVLIHGADADALREPVDFHMREYARPILTHTGRGDSAHLVERQEAHAVAMVGRNGSEPDRLLDAGDRIDLGRDVVLEVVHTPGHSPGSVCLYWEREKLLVTGDAIQGLSPAPGSLPLYFDAREFLASIERLSAMDIAILAMAHGVLWSLPWNEPVREGEEVAKTLEDTKETSLLIDRVIREAVERRPDASFLDIAREAVEELITRIPLRLAPGIGIPGGGAPVLFAHYREAMADRGIAVHWN